MLEREHEIAELAASVAAAAEGFGSVVLVSGGAGLGKSRLVAAVREMLPPRGRLLVGYCDDLATARTLGPFRDLVDEVGPDLARVLREGGDRDQLFDALRRELSRPRSPTVLAVEDLHWADDATADALSYLIRRMATLPAVLLLTYRVDEHAAAYPVRRLLGQAAGAPRVRRLELAPLTPAAVRQLSEPSRLDPHEVYAVTRGNPFFVTEILAAADVDAVPPTVVDAVLARVGRLDAETREVLAQIAVIPSTVDFQLLERLLPHGVAGAAVAERHGLLDVSPDRVGFSHELIRRTIADALPVAHSVELHRRVLAALTARDGADPSAIVHHAVRAGDVTAIVRFGPLAADDAADAGAHREAASHLRQVLQHRHLFDPDALAGLLDRYAVECTTIGEIPSALAAQQDVVELRRTRGDPRALGSALRSMSRICWMAGEHELMERSADEAVAVLQTAGDDVLLAQALSNKSWQYLLAGRCADCIRVGTPAIELAAADPVTLSHVLNNVGTAQCQLGLPDGRRLLEHSLRVALSAGSADAACRAYSNIVWLEVVELRFAEASTLLATAMNLAEDTEHVTYLHHFRTTRAEIALATGEWQQAVADAEFVITAQPPTQPLTRCPALVVLGLVRIRLGDPDGDALLTEAWELAGRMGEPQHTALVASARAESAWLRGDHTEVAEWLSPVHADTRRPGYTAYQAEVGYWLTKTGHPVPPTDSAHPYALQAAGRWREAAAIWARAGCPYQHAAALAESEDSGDLLAALSTLDAMGARPLARHVRARLRELGVSRVPRGPATATRRNPAGLTGRQLEIARLLAAGLTNAEIADRLVLSVRTVDNHVATVLAKLGASTRRQIAARAVELGISLRTNVS
ncbi:ATP-binding protein [Lentzea sp. NPDC054927]